MNVVQAKIKKFQQLTDRFRGGLIKAAVYYEGVDELFGEDNVEVPRTTLERSILQKHVGGGGSVAIDF